MDVETTFDSRQLTGIHEILDRIGVPRTYMGKESPARERVNALVRYLELRGIVWPRDEQEMSK